jgi:hypothetical protein
MPRSRKTPAAIGPIQRRCFACRITAAHSATTTSSRRSVKSASVLALRPACSWM